MVKSSTLTQRLVRLVNVAQSRRAFARFVGMSDVAVMGWEGGTVPYGRTLEQIADKTGVSLSWLKSGRGNEEDQLDKFRQRLSLYEHRVTGGDEGMRIAEEPGMECPLSLPPPSTAERALELAAANMDASNLAGTIKQILNDSTMPERDRYAQALRLTWALLHRLKERSPISYSSKS